MGYFPAVTPAVSGQSLALLIIIDYCKCILQKFPAGETCNAYKKYKLLVDYILRARLRYSMSLAEIASRLKGNERLIERLRKMILEDRLFHGYIVEGRSDEAKELADAFVKAALCERRDADACGVCVFCRKIAAGNSEDVVYILPEKGKNAVTVNEVKWMTERVMKRSYTGNRLFMVVPDADIMNAAAQNKLLKTLEEPPASVTIILTTQRPDMLLPTIRSRCQRIRMFSDGLKKETGVSEKFRERSLLTAAAVAEGRPMYSIWEDIKKLTESKGDAGGFVSIAESLYRDALVACYEHDGGLIFNADHMELVESCSRHMTAVQLAYAIECAETAYKDIAYNVSAKRAVKYMILDIQEKLNDNSNRSQI